MVAFKAHYDGKVIVPDEPVKLATNQRLIVHVQPETERTADFSAWIGMATRVPQNPRPRFKDDNSLWE